MIAANDEDDFPLPSRFQLSELVRARGMVKPITGIMFREGKVYYEVGGIQHDSCDVFPVLGEVG